MDNSVKSDGVLLLHVHREALGAGQLLAGGDLHVLISNNAVQLGIGFHNGVLHEHAVLDDGTLLDLDAAEQHAVLHRALDDAAVGQNGVGHLAARHIAGGVVVADLGCFFRISGIIFQESFYNRTEMFAAGVSL